MELGYLPPASNEDYLTGSRQDIVSTRNKMTVQLLKLSLLMDWDGISVEETALAGIIYQAFEKYERNSNCKDNDIGWVKLY